MGQPIGTLTLPVASGGNGPLTYDLQPTVPGLRFDPAARTLNGTPTQAGSYPMTYTVTDADTNTAPGDADTQTFTITVQKTSTAPDSRVCSLLAATGGTSSKPVVIPDANLRSVVSYCFQKSSGAPIYAHEMARLKSINVFNWSQHDGRYDSGGVGSLEGIQFATNLEELNLDAHYFDDVDRQWRNLNELQDLSPLKHLSKLKILSLSGSNDRIRDLSPLSGLTSLEVFRCWNCRIVDLEPLSGLTFMRELSLGSNDYLSDISVVGRLLNLEVLKIYMNSIRDISAVANLHNLEVLFIGGNDIADCTPLSGLVRLTHLSFAWNPCALPVLSGLVSLRILQIGHSSLKDIAPLAHLSNLNSLNIYAGSDELTDITSLSDLTDLGHLVLNSTGVSDLSPISMLKDVITLNLSDNRISDVSPLLDLAKLKQLDLTENPLSSVSLSTHIPALRRRGVDVSFTEPPEVVVTVDDDPLIYDDKVFVLPVDERLVAGGLPLRNYARIFYDRFVDVFDFLMFVSNLDWGDSADPYWGVYYGVRNQIRGIGAGIYSDASWGSEEKLSSVLHFPYYFAVANGPTLHEIMHRWGNNIVGPGPHWLFSSADGILGGFDIADLVDHGGGRYTAGEFGPYGEALNTKPFSPIELYLAGFIAPRQVPDLWVAEDGRPLLDESGEIVIADNGFPMFMASRVKTYTIEEIIAIHGRRDPDYSRAQTEFRAAVVLLIDRDNPATREILDTVSGNVSWFSYPGEDSGRAFNFYEATGGRATMAMDGLSRFERRGSPKEMGSGSFGTPPAPVVDYWEGWPER